MSIFLCLCRTKLFQAVLCQKFSKCIVYLNLVECNDLVRNRNIILCKHNKGCWEVSLTSFKSCKIRITEGSCNLSRTVRTEIIENNRIIFFYCCYRLSIFNNHCWFYKLISSILVIRIRNSTETTLCCLSFSLNQCFICQFYTVPSVITVHYIIASHYCCYLSYTDLFHFIHCFFYKILTGCRWCISSVQECMKINIFNAISLSQLQ